MAFGQSVRELGYLVSMLLLLMVVDDVLIIDNNVCDILINNIAR